MAVLAAAFFAEGLWVYLYEPRYYDTAALGSESAPSSSSGWARLYRVALARPHDPVGTGRRIASQPGLLSSFLTSQVAGALARGGLSKLQPVSVTSVALAPGDAREDHGLRALRVP
jgi:hypothetical protein